MFSLLTREARKICKHSSRRLIPNLSPCHDACKKQRWCLPEIDTGLFLHFSMDRHQWRFARLNTSTQTIPGVTRLMMLAYCIE